MSVRCLCYEQFPPRNFNRLRDADEFCTRLRFSTLFLQLDQEGLRFGCRRCGQVWAWILPAEPPYAWKPSDVPDPEPRPAQVVWRDKRRR